MGRKKGNQLVGAALDQTLRDQEVLRANRELAAYFKGRRTEREARAALKIIKAFVRGREHQDPKSRPPLPGAPAAKAATIDRAAVKKTRRRAPRKIQLVAEPATPAPTPVSD
ncbi:MAG TPA: hypothetical protein VGY57_01740 [Vicinamibacterales bacterium]|jgi:hypothetical protein|nr:hypothetical protein [Vicinamibacterales bacterium]